MVMTTDNTSMEPNQDLASAEEPEQLVNWDPANKFFSQKAEDQPAAGSEETGDEVTYVDEDGNPLSPEQVAAAQAEGAVIEDEPDPNELVEVRVKGRVLRLPREDAEAIEAYRQESRERDGRLGGENAQLRERLARLEGAVAVGIRPQDTSAPLEPPDPQIARTDFPEYMRQYDAYNAEVRRRERQELETKYEEERTAERRAAAVEAENQAWATAFYNEYPHLNKPSIRPLVGQVYDENARELNGYGDDYVSTMQRLAELTETRIAEIRATNQTGRPIPRVQGASTAAPQTITKAPVSEPFSTANWVARERAKMRGDTTE